MRAGSGNISPIFSVAGLGLLAAVLISSGCSQTDEIKAPTTPARGTTSDGAVAYGYCLGCHRPDGAGVPGMYPSLIGSQRLLGDARQAVALVLAGFSTQDDIAAPRWSGRMISLAQLDNAQVAAALNFSRVSWGNQATPISAATVAEVRSRSALRLRPWTPAELARTFP